MMSAEAQLKGFCRGVSEGEMAAPDPGGQVGVAQVSAGQDTGAPSQSVIRGASSSMP